MSITTEVEHHDFDESKYNPHESCERVVKPNNLKFDDDILSVKYESFSCEFDINESLDVGFCVEYESFSFDPVITDHLFESAKSTCTESNTSVPIDVNLDHILEHIERKGGVDVGPTILPR